MSISLELINRSARNAVDALRRGPQIGNGVMAEQYFTHDHPALINEIHGLRRSLKSAQEEIARLSKPLDVKA